MECQRLLAEALARGNGRGERGWVTGDGLAQVIGLRLKAYGQYAPRVADSHCAGGGGGCGGGDGHGNVDDDEVVVVCHSVL